MTLRAVPPKKDSYEIAAELEALLKTVPMVEAQRDLIKEAAERLRHLHYLEE